MRRNDRIELERRLREQDAGGPGLSPGFRDALAARLDGARDPGASPVAVRERVRPVGVAWSWAIGAGLLGAAAAVVIGVALLRPAPAPRPAGGGEVVRALGEAIQASVTERPRALALAIDRTDEPLTDEARRLLADARSLADRLAAPVRSLGAHPTP